VREKIAARIDKTAVADEEKRAVGDTVRKNGIMRYEPKRKVTKGNDN